MNKYKRVSVIIDELRWKWEKPGLELFYPTLNTREWVLFPPGICKIPEDKIKKFLITKQWNYKWTVKNIPIFV